MAVTPAPGMTRQGMAREGEREPGGGPLREAAEPIAIIGIGLRFPGGS
jgi:hypothetical protein